MMAFRTAPVRIALCALGCLAAIPAPSPAAGPGHQVKGGGVFFLDTGAPQGGNLVEEISIDARLNPDGSVQGSISSTLQAVTVPVGGGPPDPFATGDPLVYRVTGLAVVGNTAFITAVLVFAPDFPEEEGTTHDFVVVDGGGPPDSDDLVSIDGFDLPPLAAGNYVVR